METTRRTAPRIARWISLAWALGMVAIFFGERLLVSGTGRGLTTGLGALLVLGSVAVRIVRMIRVHDVERRIHRYAAALQTLGVLALLLYFAQSDLVAALLGKPLAQLAPRLAVCVQVLWPALWLAAALPLFLVELACSSMAAGSAGAARLEPERVRDAMLSGLGLAGALVFAFSVAWVASARDVKVDLSYFRTARPGEATRNLVRGLDQPVEVALFFPPGSDVRDEVRGYFADLAKESPRLDVHDYDQAVDPAKARELGVERNGMVAIARKGRKELLDVGLDFEGARNQLRSLDKEVQKRLLAVAQPQRIAYFTVGHGERGFEPADTTDKRSTLRGMREVLRDQNWQVKTLSAADGLATEVPADAGVVLIIGPTRPFLPEEVAALSRFVDRGGRLYLAFDPEAVALTTAAGTTAKAGGFNALDLLAPLGLRLQAGADDKPATLANEKVYARRYNQDSDRVNLVVDAYSSHPSVQTLARLHAPIILPGAGALERVAEKDRPRDVTLDFTIHSRDGTFDDENGNFQLDAPGERSKTWELAAALTKKKEGAASSSEDGRVFVLADSDALSDAVIATVGNAYLVLDVTRWLVGDEALIGATSSEADVPIAHTRNQDVAWFYSTIFLAPLLALGAGWWANRRRRGGGKRRQASKPDMKEAA